MTWARRFVRLWRDDELRQFVNALRGELSLVRPRAHVLNGVSNERRAFKGS